MAAITQSDISNLLIQNTPQVFSDGTTRGTYFFGRLLDIRPPSKAGGSQWKHKATGSTASAIAELDPLPAPTKFTQVDPQLDGADFVTTIEISDETLRKINSGLIVFEDYVDQQVMDATTAIRKAIEDATVAEINAVNGFVGLGAWGLDTGSPAGISRSIYSTWQAYYADASGTPRPMTMALMRDVSDVLLSTRQGRFNAVTMAATRATTYSGLSGSGQVSRVFNVNEGSMGFTPPVGIGSAADILKPFSYFDEAPCYKVPTMPTDEVWFLDTDEIHYEEVMGITVGQPQRSNRRSWIWEIGASYTLVVPNPYKNIAVLADLI